MSIDLTWLSYVALAVVVYYGTLFALTLLPTRKTVARDPGATRPFFVLVIPAHDEELVIGETLMAATSVKYDDYLVLVMNDGSTDNTSSVARAFGRATGKVEVVDRPAAMAGRGKGAVLNHALGVIRELVEADDPRLGGRSTSEIIVGVMDGDGQLETSALQRVEALFADPSVGGVQIGVRIANAADGFLARMQDLEFIGFSSFVQQARDRFGSVGLGGNGQFTRLSALLELESAPWTGCLTEDLDLGLTLAKAGWRIRFGTGAFVAQQGLTRVRPLLRQRARWIHGHYQCWQHIPSLLRGGKQSLVTRLDLCLYLLLVAFVMLVSANLAAGLAGLAGWVTVENRFLSFIPPGVVKNIIFQVIGFGPVFAFVSTYQRRSITPLKFWEIPAYGFGFALYSYLWVISTLWAWARMALRRDSWAKTRRIAARAAV